MLGLLVTLFLAGLGYSAIAERDDSLERVRDGGVLRIGYAVEAPYAFVDAQGEVSGEGPSIARHVAAELGVQRVVWVQTRFDQLIPELESGRFDVVAAGMFITPERKHRVAFSQPTFRVSPGLLVRADRDETPSDCREAATRSDLRIAVLEGAVEGSALRTCGLSTAQLVLVPDARAGFAAVATGMADGLALSAPTLRWMASADLASRMKVRPFPMGEPLSLGGFAFRAKDRALREAWNGILGSWLGSPEHRRMVEALGFSAEEVVVGGSKVTP
ncbi:MAG: transporter substrate-binding domain-containing protein [Myxococcales bacterium]|nr:transporter substrate-binding domain-containing protein [Myxococcales bacterium]